MVSFGLLIFSQVAGLAITSEPSERHLAQHFLLYLRQGSFDNSKELCTELEAALSSGMPLLLVHEQRGEYGAVPFASSAHASQSSPALSH